ncbi:MAG: serine/threonine-protein kinase [Cyanobacteria bacterium P01_A01_bin.83]
MKGNILGSRYKVLKDIAKGGFGKTYLAEDTQLPGKDLCVVKELAPTIEKPDVLPIARRLFKAEAVALHNLGHHQQIPELLAYFEEAEKFYLVQQYIAGQTLETELNSEHVWSEARIIELLIDVLQILDFIHSQGVIHRDLKPANLIRRQCDRKLVLVDFGTVKNMLQGQANLGQLTIPVGTKGYMPTEQARGKPQATSDLYALGIIAIQALTRIEPLSLEEDNQGELQWSHLIQVSPQLAQILTTMTRYNFTDRYQSAAEALQALDALTDFNLTKSKLDTAIAPVADNLTSNAAQTITFPQLEQRNRSFSLISASKVSSTSVNQNLVAVDQQSAAIKLDLPSPITTSSESKNNKVRSITGLAIALAIVIFGAIYWLIQQNSPKSPLENLQSPPESTPQTPRLDQGEGFRDNL